MTIQLVQFNTYVSGLPPERYGKSKIESASIRWQGATINIRYLLIVLAIVFGGCYAPDDAEVSTGSAQVTAPSESEQNKAVGRQIFKLLNERKLDEAFALYAEDYIYHGPGGMELRGRQAIRDLWVVFFVGFPDLHTTVDDMIAEGDKLAVRWRIEGTHTGEFMGIAPTNRKIEIGLNEIFRVENGQWAEAWDQYDMYGLMQQIGAIPEAEEETVE